MITKKYCPHCNSVAKLKSEYKIAGITFRNYECGHTEGKRAFDSKDATKFFSNYVSSDGKRPYKFQVEGALFGIQSNCRLLLADEMGIGKTIQTLMILHSHTQELTPVLWICKRGLIIQAVKEVMRWNNWIPQVIECENQFVIPGGKVFILSYDMLWRFKNVEAFMKRLGISTVVMDEVQHIKNTESKRTNGVRRACAQVDHIVALSGTPIMNNAKEYYTILNILRPDKFYSPKNYEMRWVESYFDGYKMKYGGLKNPQAFKEYTKDFIIRRTRAEVLPDLPQITRDFKFCELGDAVEEAYKNLTKDFIGYYNSTTDTVAVKNSNIMAYLGRMRHLVGLAKIEPCVDYVMDFIEEVQDRKLIIFVHHEDVGDKLTELINEKLPGTVIRIKAPIDQSLIDLFKSSNTHRVAVITTLGGGEGLNLQFCSDLIMLERQWNPGKEEQAEGRIVRIGQKMQKLNGVYFVAVGTMDEFLAELVEKKRSISANTLDFKETKWDESSIIKELSEILVTRGGIKWGF